MDISKNGLALIESFEGLRLTSYADQRGIPTVGYGHTEGVYLGMSITQAQAEAYLHADAQVAVQAVSRLVKVTVTQNEFDALVSLAFNVGQGHFAGSTVLRDLNAGNTSGAAAAFMMWDKTDGEVNAGLARRRQAEMKMFLGN